MFASFIVFIFACWDRPNLLNKSLRNPKMNKKFNNNFFRWVKFGDIKTIAFLGKEIIGIASGLHIIFINLNTKEERVEKFDNKERGEGVSCLAGHPVII